MCLFNNQSSELSTFWDFLDSLMLTMKTLHLSQSTSGSASGTSSFCRCGVPLLTQSEFNQQRQNLTTILGVLGLCGNRSLIICLTKKWLCVIELDKKMSHDSLNSKIHLMRVGIKIGINNNEVRVVSMTLLNISVTPI